MFRFWKKKPLSGALSEDVGVELTQVRLTTYFWPKSIEAQSVALVMVVPDSKDLRDAAM